MGRDSLNSWLRSVSEAKRHQTNLLQSLKRITQLLSLQKKTQGKTRMKVHETQLPKTGAKLDSPQVEQSADDISTDIPPCEKLKLHEIDHGWKHL